MGGEGGETFGADEGAAGVHGDAVVDRITSHPLPGEIEGVSSDRAMADWTPSFAIRCVMSSWRAESQEPDYVGSDSSWRLARALHFRVSDFALLLDAGTRAKPRSAKKIAHSFLLYDGARKLDQE